MTNSTIKNLIRFFKDVPGGEVGTDAVIAQFDLQRASFMNYVLDLKKQGLITTVKSKKNPRRIEKLRLTDSGRQLLVSQTGQVVKQKAPASGTDASTQHEMTDLELLDLSTKVTDKFNQQSSLWQWKLIRKEEPMQQRR